MPDIMISGISVTSGVAIGTAYILNQEVDVQFYTVGPEDVSIEKAKVDKAFSSYQHEIASISERAKQSGAKEEQAILEAQMLMLQDPALLTSIRDKIELDNKCAAWAVDTAFQTYILALENLQDDYFRQRADDLRSLRRRLLIMITGSETTIILQPDSIIIAEDLGPAETLSLDRSAIAAIITEKGGRTSHTSILARALGIPAIVGASEIRNKVRSGDRLIVDANTGHILIEASEESFLAYRKQQQSQLHEQEELRLLLNEASVTRDGRPVELWANIGDPSEAFDALKLGAQGIGLFRTEFLYMNGTALPTENEQVAAYRAVLQAMEGRPVVIRTLDIGADKQLPYLPLATEDNPALGCRAIRLCLKNHPIFRTQLRALLKASVAGNLWIMFPMIATLEELREAKQMLTAIRLELTTEGTLIAPTVKVGMMIEVPAAALNAENFADEVDFFSIGTNDLIQYLFAADRQNKEVDYLYQPGNIAVLRLISQVVAAGHTRGIPVGMCGEMAGEPALIETLIGLGLDELSMSAGRILEVKKVVRSLDSAVAAAQAVRKQF